MKAGWKKGTRAIAWILWVLPMICPADQTGRSRFETVVHQLAAGMNEAHYIKIRDLFSPEMQENYSLEKTELFFGEMIRRNGLVKNIELVDFKPPDQATYSIIFEGGAEDFFILLDAENRIQGLRVYPHSNIDLPKERTHETILYLPFRGRWKVLWGGDSLKLNIHHDQPSQVYAVDFVGLGNEGDKQFKGKGKKNTDYFAFGREILAPAEGIVIEVIDGVRDNTPGSSNPYSSLGNAVLIKHKEGEVSVLAHLQQGSTAVKPGDHVAAGQAVARCGNSGASSEPMLHYHLQDAEIIQDAKGIRCRFEKVFLERNGSLSLEPDYSPVKGDILDM